MKKLRIFPLILTIILMISLLNVPVVATEEDPAVTSGCHSVDAAMTLSTEEKITKTAKAAILYELNSGTMLYAHNPDGKIYPTSMVKMMTVLVALENADPDETVTVTRSMRQQIPIGILGIDLKTEEEISLRDLLYCTMVASATDASVVAAIHVGGSIDGFLQMMNDKAVELGCQNTHYGNVHGLHDENTYTTARDICRITEAALQNEEFRTMFGTAKYTVPATNKSEERAIKTTNNMMNEGNSKYYDKRVTGGKTGATDQGGRCLTLTAEKDGMQILCVLMGATPTMAENGSVDAYGSFEESKILIDYAFENFEFRQVFFDGQSLTQYPVSNGASHVVTQATTSISTVLPIDVDETQLKWDYRLSDSNLTAPIEKGQILGAVQVWYGTKCLAQTDMVAMNGVKIAQSPIIPEKPAGMFGGSWWIVLLIILGLGVLAFVGIVGLRMFHIMKHQQRQRRRSRRK
ncbi:MAG: D-alanyl-D-alanine carboxypeptidase [Ruminococcaceae bacterium]|nr:D-alanyl-D-alanine carboxypeptidase [Oscillospiraceae bacterium]